MICGRFYVLRSVHSCFACVYSQLATQTIVTSFLQVKFKA